MHGIIGEILGEARISSDVKLIIKFIENIKSKVEGEVSIKTGY